MDDKRFDALSRRLAGVSTRRGVVMGAIATALGGVALGTSLVGSGPDAQSMQCRPLGRHCTRDGQCCDGVCNVPAEQGGVDPSAPWRFRAMPRR